MSLRPRTRSAFHRLAGFALAGLFAATVGAWTTGNAWAAETAPLAPVTVAHAETNPAHDLSMHGSDLHAQTDHEHEPFVVAYVEGGPFVDYQRVLAGVAKGLETMGWIEDGDVPMPEGTESAEPIWNWLSEHAGGRIVFAKDGFYSAGWDESNRDEMFAAIGKMKHVDAILAFGTWAGTEFSKLPDGKRTTPVVVASVTNALESGIVKSLERSGVPNLVASIEPDRYPRQLSIFQSVFWFRKLGIAYEDTPAGRGSIALRALENTAMSLGIELIRCTDRFDVADVNVAAERLKACHRQLVERGAQAVYLTANVGLTADTAADVLEPLIEAKLPTFSQVGSFDVENGALLSISEVNLADEGAFSAGQLVRILEGQSPEAINQRYEGAVSLAVNLETAKRIGWEPPLEILVAVDEFYPKREDGETDAADDVEAAEQTPGEDAEP